MNFSFSFDAPVEQIGFYCLVSSASYEEKQLLALLDFEIDDSEKPFEGATWNISPTYGRHFHYMPQPKDGLLRLRDFKFPRPVRDVKLSVIKRGMGAPDPSKLVQDIFALTVDPMNEANSAIYKGVEE